MMHRPNPLESDDRVGTDTTRPDEITKEQSAIGTVPRNDHSHYISALEEQPEEFPRKVSIDSIRETLVENVGGSSFACNYDTPLDVETESKYPPHQEESLINNSHFGESPFMTGGRTSLAQHQDFTRDGTSNTSDIFNDHDARKIASELAVNLEHSKSPATRRNNSINHRHGLVCDDRDKLSVDDAGKLHDLKGSCIEKTIGISANEVDISSPKSISLCEPMDDEGAIDSELANLADVQSELIALSRAHSARENLPLRLFRKKWAVLLFSLGLIPMLFLTVRRRGGHPKKSFVENIQLPSSDSWSESFPSSQSPAPSVYDRIRPNIHNENGESVVSIMSPFFRLRSEPIIRPSQLPSVKPSFPTNDNSESVPVFPSVQPSSLSTSTRGRSGSFPSSFPTVSMVASPTHPAAALPSTLPTVLPTATPKIPHTRPPTTTSTVIPSLPQTMSPTAVPATIPSDLPTTTPTVVPSNSQTAIPSDSPTAIPSDSPTAIPSDSPTAIPSDSPTATPTTVPSDSPTATPTTIPSDLPTGEPTAVPSDSPTATPTTVPSDSPTDEPTTIPSDLPTGEPTDIPSYSPTATPTTIPSDLPTGEPTTISSDLPTDEPTAIPSESPTATPTTVPSDSPTATPTAIPSDSPTETPTTVPSDSPTDEPTAIPSDSPTDEPTTIPSDLPTGEPTDIPSYSPTGEPTIVPSDSPTAAPTTIPSDSPTDTPTAIPSDSPTDTPTVIPSYSPTATPTSVPSDSPTDTPTVIPSYSPTATPTSVPSDLPTKEPTTIPSDSPTKEPSSPTTHPTLLLTLSPTFLQTDPTPTDLAPTASPMTATSTETQTSPTSSNHRPTNNYSGISSSTRGKRPNILAILADDVGTGDIPVYWDSSLVRMPNLNRLSRMGVTFRDAHSTPLCAPSRYMFLSGNYQHRGRHYNGRWNLGYKNNQFQRHQKSIAEVLRDQAGYHTAMFGKWHLGAKIPPHGMQNRTHILSSSDHNWSQPLIDGPQDIGFDTSYITTGGIQESPYSFFRDGFLSTNTTTDISFWEAGKYSMPLGTSVIRSSGEGDVGWDSTAYNQILVNETKNFVKDHLENRAQDPFFAYVALGSVHLPHSPPDTYSDGSRIAGEYPNAHMDLLFELDKVVGSLISTIEDNGLAEDTIIMFFSDNGGLKWDSNFFHHSSGPLRGKKGQIYEGGHRVPLIMRHDGAFPPNEDREHLVGLNDIYATICEIVGVGIPKGSAQDSISFAKSIYSGDNTIGTRENLATWDYKSGILQAASIRFKNLKLIEHTKTSKIEFYDLQTDISEANDISEIIPEDTKREMLSKLNELGPCPNQETGVFALPDGRKVTCGYFRTNTEKRCKRFSEGEKKCNLICGRYKKMCKQIIDLQRKQKHK